MARRRHKYEKAPKFRGAAYIWLLVAILLSASVWGVSARYIQQRQQDLLAQAKMFYFSSNLLTEADGTVYTLNPDTASVTIILKNHMDSLRVSEDDIQYSIYVNDVKQGATERLTGGAASEKTFTLDVEAGESYTVKAVGNAGYTKTLEAKFDVLQTPKKFYKHVDALDDHVLLLTVWTEDVSGDVTVPFPEGLIPDNTDSKLAGTRNLSGSSYGAGETDAFELHEYESVTYRFFKDSPGMNYTADQFTVLMAGGTKTIEATEGTP